MVFRLTHDLPKENDYFKTDIPGVGLLVRHNGGVYNLKTPFTLGPGQSLHDAGFSRLSLELYQISDDLAPGILDLSRLPGIQLECAEEQAAPAWMVRFGGSLDIHTSTCEVQQDQVVYLGEHSSSSLMREGDNTPWVEFDLRLTNCGQFYGRLTTLHSSNGDLVGGVAASNHAVITGQDHTYATWTGDGWASNYPLDDSKSSSWRGEPLLIQLQMKSSNGQWGDNARRTLYGGGWPQVTEYNVPMRARYYRKNDEEPLEPGPKNASVVVMIRYE
ncbi:Fimbrial protein [compost metagenome]